MLTGFAQLKAAQASFCALDFHLYFIIMLDDAGVLLDGLLVRRRKERDCRLVPGSLWRRHWESTESMQTSLLPLKLRQAPKIETPRANLEDGGAVAVCRTAAVEGGRRLLSTGSALRRSYRRRVPTVL